MGGGFLQNARRAAWKAGGEAMAGEVFAPPLRWHQADKAIKSQ